VQVQKWMLYILEANSFMFKKSYCLCFKNIIINQFTLITFPRQLVIYSFTW